MRSTTVPPPGQSGEITYVCDFPAYIVEVRDFHTKRAGGTIPITNNTVSLESLFLSK